MNPASAPKTKGKFYFTIPGRAKPCPFCGSQEVSGSEHEGVFPYGICDRCGACGGWGNNRETATANWNQRTP